MGVKDKIFIRRIRIHTNRSGTKNRIDIEIGRSDRGNLVDLSSTRILPQLLRPDMPTPMMKPDLYPLPQVREAIK
jgi:hypothetical protein